MQKYLLLLCLFSIGMIACKGSKKTAEAETKQEMNEVDSKMNNSGITSLGIRRSGCFGKCPTFKVDIDQSGEATFHGMRFVEKLGVWKGQLDEDKLQALWKNCSAQQLDTCMTRYPSDIMDAPKFTLNVGRRDSIQGITGDFSMPKQILATIDFIDTICQQIDWTLYEANVPRSAVPGQVIIDLEPGFTAEEVCKSLPAYQLKVKKRVSPALQMYVLSFDAETMNAGRLLVELKNNPLVREAQFNNSTDQRNN